LGRGSYKRRTKDERQRKRERTRWLRHAGRSDHE
jgi:hypothetical protein